MQKLKTRLMLILLASMVSSCSVITGIFKAGMGFGIFIVILIIVIIGVLVLRGNKNK